MNFIKVTIALMLAAAVFAVTLAMLLPRTQPVQRESQAVENVVVSVPTETPPATAVSRTDKGAKIPVVNERGGSSATEPGLGKTERLAQVRENFRVLAGGDRTAAMRAAKEVKDETEREAALFTLVTEWKEGELSSPEYRASAISNFGLEAGLGMELAKDPELALLWANELTQGPGRTALFQAVAQTTVKSDPAAAFALSGQIPERDRPGFRNELFANWGGTDTAAAIQWAEQLPDPADRDAAMRAIRTTAPVGIGAALRTENGYPVIMDLVPDTPASRSGQLHAGDRIVALAEADGPLVSAYDVPLKNIVDMVRGAPNSVIQLQVVPAGAPENTAPNIIFLTRDQLKFKRD